MSIIGIDLGTTNSAVSCYIDGEAVVIPNRLGEHLTPSIVSIDENNQIFVGNIAKERQLTYPDYTASVFKRNMGTKKEYKLGNKKFLPEELSSFVIRCLKEDAETYLNQTIEEAVISVPAYFNDAQRKATKRAGELAGLKVERLINEPTAAAIAYGLHKQKLNTKFLIFDLGGGTFDISILELYKNIMEVRGVAGDNFLGGEDFTQVIVNLFAKANNLNLDEFDCKLLASLKKQAEIAKREFLKQKTVTMTCKVNDEILEYKIRADEYEKACHNLLIRLRRPIERVLNDASIKIKEIDSIVLVGGGTKLPLIRSFVARLFGRLPSSEIDPDETVAVGAAIQAAMKERDSSLKEIVLTDVCPYTLGTNISVQRANGYYEPGHFCPIIERNTVIPVSRVERLYTIHENQKRLSVEILQGESRLSKDNIYLGELDIDVPSGAAGEQSIDVRYTYDINGILEVEVTVVSTGLKKRMVIEKNPGYMSQEEIEKRLKDLSYIKIHPRDKEENKLLLAKGERLYEESMGETRLRIAKAMEWFEAILDKQDIHEIEEAAKQMQALFKEIEQDYEF